MQVLIDRFITLLKWPLALYMLVSIPAYIRSLYYFNFVNIKFIVLGAGFILFFIARRWPTLRSRPACRLWRMS